MRCAERPDDFELRRKRLRSLSDDELHARFWRLVSKIVDPLVEEARAHTSPSIERSVLLRMGFSSIEAKALVKQIDERGLLEYGAGHLILELALKENITVREAGGALLNGRYWDELGP